MHVHTTLPRALNCKRIIEKYKETNINSKVFFYCNVYLFILKKPYCYELQVVNKLKRKKISKTQKFMKVQNKNNIFAYKR